MNTQIQEVMTRSLMESRLSYQSSSTASGPPRLSSVSHTTRSLNEEEINQRLLALDQEIEDVDDSMRGLNRRRSSLLSQKQDLERTRAALRRPPSALSANRKGKAKELVVNFYNSDFLWSGGLRARMKQVFGHDTFRLCQEA